MEEKERFEKKEGELPLPTSPQKKMYFQHATEYEVLGKKGEGGMGVVEEAKDLSLGRTIVWKTIRLQEGMSPEKKRTLELRFKQEAMIQAQLDHPHILPLYNIFQHQETGQIYFTMKKVEGKTLDQFLAESLQKVFQELKKAESESQILHLEKLEHFLLHEMPGLYTKAQDLEKFLKNDPKKNTEKQALKNFPLEKFQGILTRLRRKSESDVLSILEKVCNALAYAHGKGIIHRDLKPQNIMIENYGAVYVMDWGIAKLKGEAEETEEEEYRFEESQNDFFKSSEKEDALTQTSVMMGTENYMAPEQKRDAKRATSLSDIYSLGKVLHFCFRKIYGEKIPEDINSIIAKATEKSAKDRYQKVTDILADLNHYRENQPVSSRRYTLGEKTLKFCQRHQRSLKLFGFVITLFLFSLLAYGFSLDYKKYSNSLTEAEMLYTHILQNLNHEEPSPQERREKASSFAKLLRQLHEAKQSQWFFFNTQKLLKKYPELLKNEALPLYLEDGGYTLGKVLVEESFLPEKEKQELLQFVDEKSIEKEKIHLNSLEAGIARSKKGFAEGEVEDFIFEISKMPEEAVYQRVLKEFTEGVEYFVHQRALQQSREADQHYQFIAEIVGRLGNQKAAQVLMQSVLKMKEEKKSLPSRGEEQAWEEAEIKFIVAITRALGNLFSNKSKTQLIENTEDLARFFQFLRLRRGNLEILRQTDLALKKMVDESFLQKMEIISSEGFIQRGMLRNEIGDHSGAILDYTQALQLEPESGIAFDHRGKAQLEQGNWKEAEKDFKLAIQYGFMKGYLGLGAVLQKLGFENPEKAIEALNEGVRWNPEDPLVYYNRACFLTELKYEEKALLDLNKTLQLNPHFADAYHNKGMILYKQGKFQEALIQFNLALQKNSRHLDALNSRIEANRSLGDFKACLEDYDKLIAMNPKYAGTYHSRALVKKETGDLQGAFEDLNHALILAPQDSALWNDRGILKIITKDFKGATEDLEKALSLNPKYSDALSNLGCIKFAEGHFQEALEYQQKAIQIQPKFPNAYFMLAKCYIKLKDIDSSIDTLSQGLLLQKEKAEIDFLLALLRQQLPQLRNSTASKKIKYFELFLQYADPQHSLVPSLQKELEKLKNQKENDSLSSEK